MTSIDQIIMRMKIYNFCLSTLLYVITLTTVASTASAQELDPNFYYRLTCLFQGEGKSLDVVNDGENNKVILAESGNFTGQMWRLTPTGDGFFHLTTDFTGVDRSLDVINDDLDNKLHLATSGDFTGQKWKVSPLGNNLFRLTTQFTGPEKSLDIINDESDNQLILASTANVTGQLWKLTKLGRVPAPKLLTGLEGLFRITLRHNTSNFGQVVGFNFFSPSLRLRDLASDGSYEIFEPETGNTIQLDQVTNRIISDSPPLNEDLGRFFVEHITGEFSRIKCKATGQYWEWRDHKVFAVDIPTFGERSQFRFEPSDGGFSFHLRPQDEPEVQHAFIQFVDAAVAWGDINKGTNEASNHPGFFFKDDRSYEFYRKSRLAKRDDDIQEKWNFGDPFDGKIFGTSFDKDIDAAVNLGDGTAFFFKGDHFVTYKLGATEIDIGPQPISSLNLPEDFHSDLDAAFNGGDGFIYFIKGGDYVQYNPVTKQPSAGFPKPTDGSRFDHGLQEVDAAINYGNGSIYIFGVAGFSEFKINGSRGVRNKDLEPWKRWPDFNGQRISVHPDVPGVRRDGFIMPGTGAPVSVNTLQNNGFSLVQSSQLEPGQCALVFTDSNAETLTADFGLVMCATQHGDNVSLETAVVFAGCEGATPSAGGANAKCNLGIFSNTITIKHGSSSTVFNIKGPSSGFCAGLTDGMLCASTGADLVSSSFEVKDQRGNGIGISISSGVGAGLNGGFTNGHMHGSIGLSFIAGGSISFSLNVQDIGETILNAGQTGYEIVSGEIVAAGEAVATFFEDDIGGNIELGANTVVFAFNQAGTEIVRFFEEDVAGLFNQIGTSFESWIGQALNGKKLGRSLKPGEGYLSVFNQAGYLTEISLSFRLGGKTITTSETTSAGFTVQFFIPSEATNISLKAEGVFTIDDDHLLFAQNNVRDVAKAWKFHGTIFDVEVNPITP